MLEENKAIARLFLDELWNRVNFEAVDRLMASDYDGHSSTVINGPGGARQFVPTMRAAFPDFQFEVLDQVAEGDRVATRWAAHGTHQGEFQGVPPSGKRVKITGITIFRLADRKLIEGWTSEDVLGLLQQIGVLPMLEHGI